MTLGESYDARQCRAIRELRAELSEQADETHRMIAALSEARVERDAAIAAGRVIARELKANKAWKSRSTLDALAAFDSVSGSSELRTEGDLA